MKRNILLLAAAALLAMVFCGCETGAGTTHTNPPKVTANVTSSPAPATPSASPTPDVTAAPDMTAVPSATPAIPEVTNAPATETPGGSDNPGGAIGDAVDGLLNGGSGENGGEAPQPRRGGLM